DPGRAVAAMRWDSVNPWASLLEKLSSHPLVVNRIKALEEAGLPGAPQRFSVLRGMTGLDQQQIADARARFGRELTIGLAPHPVPFLASLFGLFQAKAFIGQDVVAQGWYRRGPGPVVELRRVTAADGRHARCYTSTTRHAAAWVLVVAGVLTAVAGLAG